jgi:hypothetical protein
MFRRFALALAAGLLAAPALAEQSSMSNPIDAASLHEGPLDMVAYYEPAPHGALEVTATFAPRAVTMMAAAPMRIVMALSEGDDVAFSMPGYPDALYRFTRTGSTVAVSVRPVERVEAAASVKRGL